MLPTSPQPGAASLTDEDALFAWVAEVCGGPVQRAVRASGGNRCRSWAIDVAAPDGTAEMFLRYAPPRPASAEPYTVHREAQVYRAIAGAGLRAPRLIAEHPTIQAVLTTRAPGIAEFRRLSDPAEKQAIACELMDTLARLHRVPAAPGFAASDAGWSSLDAGRSSCALLATRREAAYPAGAGPGGLRGPNSCCARRAPAGGWGSRGRYSAPRRRPSRGGARNATTRR